VINNNERVTPETRKRVEAAIRELKYSPNAVARSMARGRTSLLACLSPTLIDFTYASIIEAAETEARRLGYFLLTASAPDAESFSTLVEQLIDSRRAEGVLVIAPYMDARHARLPRSIPTVFVGTEPVKREALSVCLDERLAGYTAVRHLLDLGHQQILHITGPMLEDCSRHRLEGYREALKLAGVQFDPGLIIEGDWSATAGYQIVQQFRQDGRQFTAIFAQNDRMAVGAIRALRESGKCVPEDVSVIGFDDMPLASYFDPPLTTMRQDLTFIGSEAARLLIRRVEEPKFHYEKISPEAELILRSTTARR
jgi:LacI family repressor for deo operon, udp, cdd, tsx, nupC, and nupG